MQGEQSSGAVLASLQCSLLCTFSTVESKVGEKRYLAEAVLWTQWKHRGTLTAVSDAKLAMQLGW